VGREQDSGLAIKEKWGDGTRIVNREPPPAIKKRKRGWGTGEVNLYWNGKKPGDERVKKKKTNQ